MKINITRNLFNNLEKEIIPNNNSTKAILLNINKLLKPTIQHAEQPQSIENAKRNFKLTEEKSIERVRQACENGNAKLKVHLQEKRETIKEGENSFQKNLRIAQEKGAKIRQKSERQSTRLLNILKRITPKSENPSNIVIQCAERWANHRIEKAKQKEFHIIDNAFEKNHKLRDTLIEQLKKKTDAIEAETLEEVQTIRKKELIFILSAKRELLALVEELNKNVPLVEVTKL